jgi:glycosyltransferase involved in cell wall biosynthesis
MGQLLAPASGGGGAYTQEWECPAGPDASSVRPTHRPKGESVAALVSVIVPTLNEAENLRVVLPQLSHEYEVVIVDGGSKDGTIEVARELRPDAIIVRQPGRGKGDALLCGFAVAAGDVLVMFDADGSAKADEIPRFIEALRDADFAKGSRFVAGGGSADLTHLRSLGNLFLCGLVNLLHRTSYTDLCYGFNAFRRSCLPYMPEDAPGFEIETMMNIRIAHADLRVVEVPSYEESRQFGKSNLNTFRDGFKILRVLIGERFRSKRGARVPDSRTSLPASTPLTVAFPLAELGPIFPVAELAPLAEVIPETSD